MGERGIVPFPLPLRVHGIKFDAVSVKCTDIFDMVLLVAAFDSRMRFLQELRGSFVSAILNLGGTVTTSTIAAYYIRSSRMMQPMKTFTAGLTISDASEMNIGFCQMR
jgi:hypothetical protein